MENLVHPKEKLYYAIALVFSIVVYGLIAISFLSWLAYVRTMGMVLVLMVLFYLLIGVFAFIMVMGFFIARIKLNAVKLSDSQFGDVYGIVRDMAKQMELPDTPDVYLMQEGGLLNAFATRFLSRNYVIIFSEVFELAYTKGEEALRFVIGHELGHIKRKHLQNRWMIYPGFIIPFLAMAYSRACEYTCDRFGKYYGKTERSDGLLVLAAGKDLYTRMNEEEFIRQANELSGFFVWWAEKMAPHPPLGKRVRELRGFKI